MKALFLGCRTRQNIICHPLFFQPLFDDFQHRCKLGKEQNLMAALHAVPDQIDTRLELGGAAVIVAVAEMRIAADLAQLRQLSQDLNPVRAAVSGLLQLLSDLPCIGGVQILLFLLEAGIDNILQLIGKFLQHILL